MFLMSGQASKCLLLNATNSNRRRHYHLLFSQLGNKCNSNNNVQPNQRPFGSSPLHYSLASNEKKLLQSHHQQQTNLLGYGKAVGDCKKMLLVEQRRFFAADGLSSSSSSPSAQKSLMLDKKVFQLDSGEILHLQFVVQGTTAGNRRYFKLMNTRKEAPERDTKFKRITFVSEEAYQLISAMDNLLNTLAMVVGQQGMGSNSSDESAPLVVLGSQRISAEHYDIQLSVTQLNPASYELKVNTIKTAKEERHRERELRWPVQALPWLRQTLAQMLAEHDDNAGSKQQQLGPAPPAELPV